MFPKWIEYISIYFSLLGFLPGKSTKFVKNYSARSVIFIIHLFLSVWCAYRTIKTLEYQRNLTEFLDVLNFFVYCVICSILYVLVLYDSFISRYDQHGFWQSFTQINERFCTQLQIKKLDYFLTLFLLLIGDIFLCIFICRRQICDGNHITHIIFMIIVDSRMFFYLLHLKIIAHQLWNINCELRRNFLKIRKNIVKIRLKWIRNDFLLIHKMTQHVNNIFGWSHMILILLIFQCTIVFLNAMYRMANGKFINFDPDIMTVSSVLMVCRVVIHLFYFNKETSDCYKTVKS